VYSRGKRPRCESAATALLPNSSTHLTHEESSLLLTHRRRHGTKLGATTAGGTQLRSRRCRKKVQKPGNRRVDSLVQSPAMNKSVSTSLAAISMLLGILSIAAVSHGQTTRPSDHPQELLRLTRDLKDQEAQTHFPRLGYDAEGNVVCVVLSADRGTDQNVRLLPEFPHLTRVWIHCPRKRISPEAFAELAKVGHLKELRFDDMFLDLSGSAYAKTLAKIPTLTSLHLTWGRVNREFLSALTRLPELKRLAIRQTETLDDSNIGILRACAGLEDLDLHGTAVTDKCLNTLAEFSALKRLHADLTGISEAAVRRSKLIGRVKVTEASRQSERDASRK
jgi:hypothetical protein